VAVGDGHYLDNMRKLPVDNCERKVSKQDFASIKYELGPTVRRRHNPIKGLVKFVGKG